MTDLVQKLVGALENFTNGCSTSVDAHAVARAALSEAKAGGWVAVPVEPTEEMVDAAEDVEDLYKRGTPHTWISVYRAMLAARPLPAPPAQKEPT